MAMIIRTNYIRTKQINRNLIQNIFLCKFYAIFQLFHFCVILSTRIYLFEEL